MRQFFLIVETIITSVVAECFSLRRTTMCAWKIVSCQDRMEREGKEKDGKLCATSSTKQHYFTAESVARGGLIFMMFFFPSPPCTKLKIRETFFSATPRPGLRTRTRHNGNVIQ